MLEKPYENVISEIVPGSIGKRVGIESGDILVSINGQKIEDIIEYMFFISDERLDIRIKKKDGEIRNYNIRKAYDEDLGIVFENPIIDQAKSCRNKCVFCFIDQLPSDMRETLYFKDDDSRLSFLQGNFVTLTNMSDEDIEKIIRYRISPINVSIHTTDAALRIKMLNNKTAGNIYERLKRLTDVGIRINGQIVLCPSINDGESLDKTIMDLARLYPALESVAIVPVGVTNFREKLFPLNIYDKDSANVVIEQIDKWQKELYKKIQTRFVFLSDEFYVLSNRSIPSYEDYEGFSQIENGVGLMAMFEHGLMEQLLEVQSRKIEHKRISIVTGISASTFLTKLCKKIEQRIQGLELKVYAIENNFFGRTITVAGLVTGQDILEQLKNKDLGERIIIPESMLKAGEKVFLDDITVGELQEKLGIAVVVSAVDGKKFIKKILE
jgi:putative radical SAM enzyme (TIGR03279 family)